MLKGQIRNGLIRKFYEHGNIPDDLFWLADPSRERIDKCLTTSEIFAAILDNKIIRAYGLYQVDAGIIEIKNISAHDEFQGIALRNQMLKDAFKRAKGKCIKSNTIGTGNSSIGQLYLYQQVGFEN